MGHSRDGNSVEDYSQNRSSETPFNNELQNNVSMSSASVLNTAAVAGAVSKSQVMKGGHGTSVRNRAENVNMDIQTGPGMISRGGNILINEFLQRERKNQEMKGTGPVSSLENLNQRASEQENIIISNQERKQEV